MILKPGDKRFITDFEELVDIVKASTTIDIYESAGDKRKRIKFLLGNYEAFCNYYFPEYCYAPMAHFHKDIQKEIYQNENHIFLEQWSRGFAKTTHLSLFLPLFIKFNEKLNGMMIGSYNQDMAAEKLADIQVNLKDNQRITNDFGVQFSYGNWEDGIFKTRDDVGFYAFGKGQSPRGTKFKFKRPNYGLIDDLNDARQLKNKDIALEDKAWVMEEFKPALWTRRWWLPIAQNKFHDNTVTALLEDDDDVKTIVHRHNMLNEKGKSNWVENPDWSEEAIISLKESEGAGFIRERMNTPFEEGKIFKAEHMHWAAPLPLHKYNGVLIHYLDPSYKGNDKSDFKAWILLGKYGMEYHILKAWIRRTDSKAMWEHAYDMDEWAGDKATISHSMEANFMQVEVHEKELERCAIDRGRMLRLGYDRRSKIDKFERIETMQPLFIRGLIKFNEKEKDNADMKLLHTQLLAIEKGSRINDDGPDALEGAIWMADRAAGRQGTSSRSGKYKQNTKRNI